MAGVNIGVIVRVINGPRLDVRVSLGVINGLGENLGIRLKCRGNECWCKCWRIKFPLAVVLV